jgi:DNA/RNA-binding domain of Phe-tRNA-synthetase-like protein
MSGPGRDSPEPGWIDPELAQEMPGLGLFASTVPGGTGRSPAALKEKLGELSDRFRGAQAINLRNQPIPWAYRVFFRHIGLDPDTTRTPAEQLALDRMHDGRFRSRGRIEDALTVATAETGVALIALDADRLTGQIGLRLSAEEERFEGRVGPLPAGTIVIADDERPLAVLFGTLAPAARPSRDTTQVLLAAIRVAGVPDIAVEEALWLARTALSA